MTSGRLSAFVTLLVTLGPIETAAVFAGLTTKSTAAARRRIALRGAAVAVGEVGHRGSFTAGPD